VVLQFVPYLSKYISEFGLIFGITCITLVQLLNFDFVRGAANLGLFVIAGARLAPSIFRIQQSFSALLAASDNSIASQKLLSDFKEFGFSYSQNAIKAEEFQKDAGDSSKNRLAVTDTSFVSVGILVEVQNLTFDFLDGKSKIDVGQSPLLSNLSFELQPGTINALTGRSGEGKSTLVDLLIGELAPSKGSIFFDGIASKEFISRFPGAVSLVSQKPVILHETLAFNVSLKESLSDEERDFISDLLYKLELSDLHLSLSSSLDTLIGYGGRDLSGGQIQRISLARALFTKPRLLILDEFTSALDATTELVVKKAIADLAPRCTILVISHRMDSIADCGQFMVLKNGRLQKFSEFEELLDSQSAH